MQVSTRQIPVEEYRRDAERHLREAMEHGTDLELVSGGRVVLHLRAEDLNPDDLRTRPAALAGTLLAQSDLTQPSSDDWVGDEGDGIWEPPDAAA